MDNNEVKLNNVKFEDLIVAKKNGKSAIFNKEESYFLTNHEYDRILLSESGHHIVYRADDIIDEEGRLLEHWGEITYSAVVDNFGNIKEFENLNFGYNGSFVDDICPAFNKETKKVHLVDFNKGVISNGFKRITLANNKYPFGLYLGLEYSEEEQSLYVDKLLFKDGSELPLTIKNDDTYPEVFYFRKATEITTIEYLIELIKKYGSNIIEFSQNTIFSKIKNFYTILETVNEFYPNQINYVIEILSRKINFLENLENESLDFDMELNIKPKILADYSKKGLNKLMQDIFNKKNNQ